MPEFTMQTETEFSISIFSPISKKMLQIANRDILEFTFIEDIFGMVPVATLEFIDRSGVIEALPIKGQEVITIAFGPAAGSSESGLLKAEAFVSIGLDFKSENQTAGSAMGVVCYKLVNPFYLTLNFRRYSRSWSGKKGTEIIRHICTHMMGDGKDPMEYVQIEESQEIIDKFIMPYWTPSETIRWLLKRMSGSKSLSPGYLFYCNSKGFNLVTIPYLINDVFNPTETSKYFFTSTGDEQFFDENRILGHKTYPPSNQALERIAGGIKYSPDFFTKDQKEDIYFNTMQLEKYSSIFNGSENLFKDVNSHNASIENVAGGYTTMNNMFGNEWIRRYIKQLQIDVLVKGNVKRFAGMKIFIDWPSIAGAGDKKNELYTGRWLGKINNTSICTSTTTKL